MLTAIVHPVKIGHLEIEGLLFPDGSFGVAVPQIADLFETSRNTAARDFKRLLGADFETSKYKTEFNQATTLALKLPVFERVLRKLDRAGNKAAQALVDDLVGLSLIQLFSDAFGQKFDAEDRQNWLKDRQETKDTFWGLTDEIAEWIAKNGSSYPQHHYIASFKAMSLGLFGLEPNQIKAGLKIGKADLNRDYFNKEALRRITDIQRLAAPLIMNDNVRPEHAVKQAIATFHYTPIDYKA